MQRSPRSSTSPLVRITATAVRYPKLSLGVSLAMCLMASLAALQVQLATSVSSLLPTGSPVLERFGQLEQVFGSTDLLFLAVESDADDASRERRAALVDHLSERAAKLTWDPPGDAESEALISGMVGNRDEALAPAVKSWFAHDGWLLLDQAGEQRLFGYLEHPKALAKKLSRDPNVPPAHLKDALRYDPLGAFAEEIDRFSNTAAGAVHYDQRGYLVSDDGGFNVLLLHASRQSAESDFCKALINGLEDIRDEIHADPTWEGNQVSIIGGYVIAHRDYQEAFNSAFITLASSLLGVLILFAIAYRSMRLAMLIAVCLLPALGASLGAASLVLRMLLGGSELSMIVSGFAAILIGLGVDFFIHLYNAYGWGLSERLNGGPGPSDTASRRTLRGEAAVAAIERVGGGIAAAAFTSIATFLVLLSSHYRGMWELGAVCGLGLVIILIQAVIAAPAFLTLFGSCQVRPSHALDGFAGSLVSRPKVWATGLIVLLVGSGLYLASQPEFLVFERDPRKLRPANDTVYSEQVAMAVRLGLDESGHNLLIRGGTAEAQLSVAHALGDHLQPLTEDAELSIGGDAPVTVIDGPAVSVPVIGDAAIANGRRALRSGHTIYFGEGTGPEADSIMIRRERGDEPADLAPGDPLVLRASVARLPRALAILPRPDRQRHLLARAAALDWVAIDAAIAGLPEDERAKRSDFLAGLTQIRERAETGQLLLPGDYNDSPLAPIAAQLYGEVDGEPFMRLPLNMIDKDPTGLADLRPVLGLSEEDVATFDQVSVGAAGAPAIAMEIERLLVVDFQRLGLLALAAVTLLVIIGLRSVRGTIQAMFSLGGGLLVSLATMHVVGMDWNLMNISVLPLIIGIGIDNGIHFVHALRHSHMGGVAAVRQAIKETGHPILMTAATSIVGFGSLMLNGFRGIQTVGITACIGIAACLVVAMIGLPLASLWLVKRHETKMTLKAVE